MIGISEPRHFVSPRENIREREEFSRNGIWLSFVCKNLGIERLIFSLYQATVFKIRIILPIARIFISPPLYCFSFSNHVIKVTDAAISLRVLLRWKKRVWLYTQDLIKPYRRLARSGITRVSRSPSWRVTIALPRESSTSFSLCRPSIRLYAKKDAEWDHRGNINDLRCWSEPAWRRSTLVLARQKPQGL